MSTEKFRATDGLVARINEELSLTDEEQRFLRGLLRERRLKRKQYLVQPGFPCRERTYVVEGALRAYLYDAQDHEHTVAFAVEGWWISDFNSYIYQQPATLFVEALEPSTVVQMDYADEVRLLERYPQFERYLRVLYQRSLAALQRRVLANLSLSAEDRYAAFLQDYPQLAHRVPQYALASYLGFSSEYLSKIRRRQAES